MAGLTCFRGLAAFKAPGLPFSTAPRTPLAQPSAKLGCSDSRFPWLVWLVSWAARGRASFRTQPGSRTDLRPSLQRAAEVRGWVVPASPTGRRLFICSNDSKRGSLSPSIFFPLSFTTHTHTLLLPQPEGVNWFGGYAYRMCLPVPGKALAIGTEP